MFKSSFDGRWRRREILTRNSAQLAVVDVASSDRSDLVPLVFIHGWCCNSAMFAPQVAHFSRGHRVLAPDLCGHGASSAPDRDYTVDAFADDLAWMVGQYSLKKPVVVGHSMGGTIALHFAARFPELTSGIAMIDSALFPSADLRSLFEGVAEDLRAPDYRRVIEAAADGLFLPTDDPIRKAQITGAMAETPQHVARSALVGHLLQYDASWAMSHCECPLAYIATARPLTALEAIRAARPNLMMAQTLGVGHFAQLDAPEQINAMLDRFIDGLRDFAHL